MSDLALVNGRVITMNPAQPAAEAVLARAGRIAHVGSTAEVASLRAAPAETIDLRGRVVLPGFIDTHVHLTSTGLAKQGPFLDDCRSIPEVLARLKGYPYGQKTIFRAAGLDISCLEENRFPTRWELDEVFGDHLAYVVSREGHAGIVNSRTLAYLSLPEDVPGLDRDQTTGAPNGVLRSLAWEMTAQKITPLFDIDGWFADLPAVMEDALRVGITTIHALDGGWVADMVYGYREMAPLKIVLYYQTMDVEDVLALGLPRIGGCLLVDGSLGPRTAALSEPYADDPFNYGVLYFTDEDLTSFVYRVHAAGLQLSMHAIGDRAIEQLITAYESALAALPRPDHRHRIEHFGLATPEQIRRAARLGLHIAVQPAAVHVWGGEGNMLWQRLGPARYKQASRLSACLDAGIVAGGGSDSYVMPMNPLLGIQAAANRGPDGLALDMYRAIALYTAAAARLAFEEGEKGSITPGRAADFVVLEDDPFLVKRHEIKDIPVVTTIVDGEVKYAATGT